MTDHFEPRTEDDLYEFDVGVRDGARIVVVERADVDPDAVGLQRMGDDCQVLVEHGGSVEEEARDDGVEASVLGAGAVDLGEVARLHVQGGQGGRRRGWG